MFWPISFNTQMWDELSGNKSLEFTGNDRNLKLIKAFFSKIIGLLSSEISIFLKRQC